MPNAPSLAADRRLQRLTRERGLWLGKVHSQAHFYSLFDHLPGVSFYCKNAEGRFMLASSSFLRHHRLSDESEILGLTDFDLAPSHMASGYVEDDARLLSGETALVERVELWFDEQGTPDWYFVSKQPLQDTNDRICGTAGVVRRAAEHERQLPMIQSVARAVEIMRREFAGPLVLSEVARTCGLSVRHFQRRFQSAFGFSPQEFLMKTRILAAMKLLEETNLSVGQVALRCGFVDGSSFAEQWRQRMDQSPTTFRTSRRGRGPAARPT